MQVVEFTESGLDSLIGTITNLKLVRPSFPARNLDYTKTHRPSLFLSSCNLDLQKLKAAETRVLEAEEKMKLDAEKKAKEERERKLV